jgi:hypothetical protein
MEGYLANITASVAELLKIEGGLVAAVVDANSGMVLGKDGAGLNIDIAAAGMTEVVRAELRTMNMLGQKEKIEDIIMTLGNQYHIIRPILEKPGLFIYVVLDKIRANLAMARYRVNEIEAHITI